MVFTLQDHLKLYHDATFASNRGFVTAENQRGLRFDDVARDVLAAGAAAKLSPTLHRKKHAIRFCHAVFAVACTDQMKNKK